MEEVRNSSDLVIVSAYGRGHWLALECARRKWQVTLIDMTSAFGAYAPEDWEGPWGFFDTPELLPSQRKYLLERDQVYPVANGFTFWLKRGPIEMTGPLASFQATAAGVSDEALSYLEAISREPIPEDVVAPQRNERPVWISNLTLKGLQKPEPLKGLERVQEKLRLSKFSESWLAYLGHAFSSVVLTENIDAIDFGAPAPLRSPYGVRHISAESIEAGFVEMERAGVRVIRTNDIYDVRVQSGAFEAVVLADGRQVEKAKSFAWMLTSTETKRFHARLSNSLYPNGNLPPSWMWSRFRFRLKGASAKALPLAFTLIESIFLPWTHSNFVVAKRLRSNDQSVPIDVWLRVPARVIGDTIYFQKLAQECIEILKSRLPLSEPSIEALPLESELDPHEPYNLRFPIYSEEDLENLETVSARNLFIASPEQWQAFDWNTQMRYQAAVLSGLERLRAHWENVQRRLEAEP